MTKAQYHEYLKSDHWRQLKKRKSRKRCGICKSTENLQVHHLNYRNIYDVKNSDLLKLCDDCHSTAHVLIKSGGIQYASEENNDRFQATKRAVLNFRAEGKYSFEGRSVLIMEKEKINGRRWWTIKFDDGSRKKVLYRDLEQK